MSILDNLAAGDESCGGALDAAWIVDHGCHGGHGDLGQVAVDAGWVLWEPPSLL